MGRLVSGEEVVKPNVGPQGSDWYRAMRVLDPHPYATAEYAATLTHVGRPLHVPEWGTSVIARPIPGGGEDVIGCYPVCTLPKDADIQGGLARLKAAGYVSVTLVLDNHNRPDRLPGLHVREFKTHYLHEGIPGSFLGRYAPTQDHRYKIRRAKRDVDARPIKLADHLNAWCGLYDDLVRRHILTGVHAFPRESFTSLAQIGGIEAIGGFVGDELVCCNIWAVNEDPTTFERRAFSHLVASNKKGYELRAAYAVTDAGIRHFSDCSVVNLGGSAGHGDKNDGLKQFKAGFANSTSQAWLATAILDEEAYDKLSEGKAGDYFPLYRS
jgi:hypothetical protein